MNLLLENLSHALKKKLKKTKMPTFEVPMLATLTDSYFSNENWIYERKLDGVRVLLFKNKNHIFIKSRNNKERSPTYPELIEAAQTFDADQLIIDGEIVAFDGKLTSFAKLQPRMSVNKPSAALVKKIKIYFYVFDILYLDGYDLTRLPLMERKALLKKVLSFKDPLRFMPHKSTHGKKFFAQVCAQGLEGLIAKKKDSSYVHERSRNWLKFKCIQQQEMVIGGYTDPRRSRIGFGALLVGYFDKNGKLQYAGKVGTGYSEKFLQSFFKKLQKIETKKNPFAASLDEKDVHFVRPVLVAEIGFQEWTRDNKLRQARFLGVRDDKKARDIVKETPRKIVSA